MKSVSVVSSPWRLLPLVVLSGATSFAAPPVPMASGGNAQPKLAVGPSASLPTPPRMEIRGLTVPAGYEGAIATRIDDDGSIYGYAFNGASYFEQTRRAVRWNASGVATKLGPDNATDGEAIGTMGGQLVYWARAKEGGVDKLTGWIGSTAVANFVPRGIQNAKVYGWKYSTAALDSGSGYVWPGGETVFGIISTMNASGVIGGTARVPEHHYWYELAYGTTAQFALLGRYGEFRDVDGNGVAVGFRSIIPNSSQGDIKAYRFKPGSVDQELGTLGGPDSAAQGVNVLGDTIVGWANDAGGMRKAFIHKNGRMIALDTLVDYPPSTDLPATPQMWLWSANAINKEGRICGVGYAQGKAVPFVLKPKATTGIVAVNLETLKVHVVGRALPAVAIDRKVAARAKK